MLAVLKGGLINLTRTPRVSQTSTDRGYGGTDIAKGGITEYSGVHKSFSEAVRATLSDSPNVSVASS